MATCHCKVINADIGLILIVNLSMLSSYDYPKYERTVHGRHKDTGCNAMQSQYGHSLHNQAICLYL